MNRYLRSAACVAWLLIAIYAASGHAANPFDQKLSPEKRITHLLNRLAYGPRPGDIDDVRRLGVETWIRRQLYPERIPQSPLLERKLQPLGSLQLATWQVYEGYMSGPAGMMMASAMSPSRLLAADQLVTFRSGSADQRRAILMAASPAIRRQLLLSLPAAALQDLPDMQVAAFNERAAEKDRLRPPLTEILTPAQLKTLMSGTEDEKTTLLSTLSMERRQQVLRQVEPEAVPEVFRREVVTLGQPAQMPLIELIDSKLYRAIFSTRQLEELLVDFWVNHFNVFSGKGPVRTLLTSYERDAIRPHVLGRFRDMLLATARHPAMLFYLDNWQSQGPRDDETRSGLNENYGRELMELHTLGAGGGYTQDDVVAVARAFTGWTIHEPGKYGEFFFNPAMHDREQKVVLGHTLVRGGGEDDGIRVIDILARHPSTARFIARKLAQRFVADDPPLSLVERVAVTFTKTDGDLRRTMETLLLAPEFMSDGAWQAKLKSPFEFVVSALRTLDAGVDDTVPLAQKLADMGQPLYGKTEPTGYLNTSAQWASSAGLLSRMQFAWVLTAGAIPGVTVDARRLETGNAQVVTLASVFISSPDFQKR